MQKIHKEIILGAVVVLLGLFSWYFLRYVFYIGGLTAGCWIWGGILFILFGIALCLAMLLIKDKRILYGSLILTLIIFGMFFNNEPFYYLVALIILLLAFWGAVSRIKKEEGIQVSLDFWRIWKRGLPILITALCLLIALVYYFSPELMNNKEIKIKVSEGLFNAILKPIEGLIKEKLPQGIDLDSEVNKMLSSDQKKDLERQFGIKIGDKDTGRGVLYKLVDFQLNNITGPYKKFIPFGLAVGLFITLKIISILYVAIVIISSWLVLKILIALKFAKLEKIQKEVEKLKL